LPAPSCPRAPRLASPGASAAPAGQERSARRRPRAGKHVGRVRAGPGGTLRCELRWPEPFGGEGADVFRLVGRDTLSVASNLTVHGRSAGYTTVYRRRA